MAITKDPPAPDVDEVLEQPEPLEPDLVNDGRTIYQRMASILDELPAIGKTQRNTQQDFMFRGHDDVLNALTPLLAKHGVVIMPSVLDRTTAQRTTRQNSIMYEVNLHIEYTCFGAAGDSIAGSAWGEGTDMGDKATMKAGTMAFKAFLNQTFAINTEEGAKHDADKTTMEETVREAERPRILPPRGWKEALERFDAVTGREGDGQAWLSELVEFDYDVSSISDLSSEQKANLMRGFGTAMMLLEERYGDLSATPGVRQIVAGVFAETNGGAILSGPEYALDAKEAEEEGAADTHDGAGGAKTDKPESGASQGDSPDTAAPAAAEETG